MTLLATVSDSPQGVNFIRIGGAEALKRLAVLADMDKVNHNPLCGIGDFLGVGAAFIAYTKRGEELALVVIQKIDRAHGKELEVRAALSLSSRGDLTETVLPALEAAFGWDCQQMTIYTKRPGLVKKLQSAGYGAAATIMRKAIKQ